MRGSIEGRSGNQKYIDPDPVGEPNSTLYIIMKSMNVHEYFNVVKKGYYAVEE